MLCKISNFHGCDYEECRLLDIPPSGSCKNWRFEGIYPLHHHLDAGSDMLLQNVSPYKSDMVSHHSRQNYSIDNQFCYQSSLISNRRPTPGYSTGRGRSEGQKVHLQSVDIKISFITEERIFVALFKTYGAEDCDFFYYLSANLRST
jgi:hypothetical protein